MFDFIVEILRNYPPIALFLVVGIGFLIGKIRIGSFSLGSVASVLLVAVAVGQLNIPMSGPIKMVFFMLFLFSIGYSVGPDFFHSLRGKGAKQAIFAVCMSACCFGVTLLISYLMQYSKGITVGLFSGSQTCSALLGVGSEAISRMDIPQAEKDAQLNIIPVCYAVTYIFGTLGTVLLLGNFGPKLLGGLTKVKEATKRLEKELNAEANAGDPAYVNAQNAVAYRSYHVESEYFGSGRTVHDTERHLRNHGLEVYIDRIQHNGDIFAPRHDDMIRYGDEIVVCGRSEYIVHVEQYIGVETDNEELLSYPLQRVGVVVVKKQFIGVPISELRKRDYMHGVVIRDAVRNRQPLEISKSTVFEKGDRLTVLGRPVQVKLACRHIGHIDRQSVASDLMFVCLAIFIGGLFGAMSIWIGSIPVSFGTSGGALVAGLVAGWWRSKRPTFGNIPPAALWIMNNLGLNVFIGVIGLEAAPSFVAGIKAVGPMLFVVGAIGTLVPLCVGLWLGHKVFKFNPAITLGCCAGTRTCTAALGAVQDSLGSTIPAIGYTVTYAVSNLLLVIWGLLTVLLVA